MTAAADSLSDAFAAALVPVVLGAVLIEIDSYGSVSAGAVGAVGCGTVASADICVACDD